MAATLQDNEAGGGCFSSFLQQVATTFHFCWQMARPFQWPEMNFFRILQLPPPFPPQTSAECQIQDGGSSDITGTKDKRIFEQSQLIRTRVFMSKLLINQKIKNENSLPEFGAQKHED